MPALKNERYEFFVREYIKLGAENSTEAYRRTARKFGRKLTHWNSAAVIGGRLVKRAPIKRRIQELRQQMIKRHDITIDKILNDYAEAMTLARSQGRADQLIAGATAQAKLVGLLRDRVETGAAGEFDTLDNISDVLEKVAEVVGPDVALALSKAMGLSEETEEAAPAPNEEQEQLDLEDVPVVSRTVN